MKLKDNIPNTLEEAIEILTKFFVNSIDEIKGMSEDDFICSNHFGAGMFIRNSWQLWWHENHGYEVWSKEKPKLIDWFNSIDVYHADDMSSILMTCFYRSLVSKKFDIQKQVDLFKKHWKECGFDDGICKVN